MDNQPTPSKEPTKAEEQLIPGIEKPMPEEVVYIWQAPSRPFKQRNRKYYTTVGLIVLLVSLILLFAGQFLPIAVVIAVAFLAYVLSAVPPEVIENKITTYGIRIEDQLYYWEELGRFWFITKNEQETLHIEVARFPYRLTLLVGKSTQEELRTILSEALLEQKPEDTWYEKAAKRLEKWVPLDSD